MASDTQASAQRPDDESEPAASDPSLRAADLMPRESVGYPRDEFDVDVVPGQRRGAHRAATPPVLAMLPWLLVAVFVIACLVTLVTFVGGVGQPVATTSPTTSATATASPTTTVAPPPEPNIDQGVRLVIYNGTRTVRASAVETKLVKGGWIVDRTRNNSTRSVQNTVVAYKSPDLRETADALVAFLGAGITVEDPSMEEDMRILIGKDYLTNQTQTPTTASPTTS